MSTPNKSFYENAEAFDNFHKYASYYQALQRTLVELIQAPPKSLIVEFGSATGATTRAVARRYSDSTILGIDFREEITTEAQRLSPREGYPNLHFVPADMCDINAYIPFEGRYPDVIYSLYAFHHVPDPIENKRKFAQDLFDLPVERLRVVIADELVQLPAGHEQYAESVVEQWDIIAQEAYRSVLLNRYIELLNQGYSSTEAEDMATIGASYTRDVEAHMGETTAVRHDEYPVTQEEMLDIWLEAGFNLKFQTQVNSFVDGIFVFSKGERI